MKKTIIIVIAVIVVILLAVGGYFLFANNSNKNDNSAETNTYNSEADTSDSEEATQDIAFVDVNFYASELYDSLVLVDESITQEAQSLDDDIASLGEIVGRSDDYNNFVQDLSNDEYATFKEAWQAFLDEAKSLYSDVENQNYSQDTGLITTDTIHTCFTALGKEFEAILDSTDNSDSSDDVSDDEAVAEDAETTEDSDTSASSDEQSSDESTSDEQTSNEASE